MIDKQIYTIANSQVQKKEAKYSKLKKYILDKNHITDSSLSFRSTLDKLSRIANLNFPDVISVLDELEKDNLISYALRKDRTVFVYFNIIN